MDTWHGRLARWLRLAPPVPACLPDPDWDCICSGFACLGCLSGSELAGLRELAGHFVARKQFLGRGDAAALLAGERGHLLRWAVAAQACLPVLHLGLDCYRDWKSLILLPRAGTIRQYRSEGAGIMTEYDEEMAGEILPWGPVVLSLADIGLSLNASGSSSGSRLRSLFQARPGPRREARGYNVVIHEMIHKLDLLNGSLDACPDLPPALRPAWNRAFRAAWEDFSRQADQPGRRRRLSLDDYAAESPEEFLAVAAEEFFERPNHLRLAWPDLYGVLAAWLQLDPAAAAE